MTTKDVYKVSDEEFIAAVKSSTNIYQTLIKLGMNARGRAYSIFKNRCKRLNIDTSHFKKYGRSSYLEIRNRILDDDIIKACAAHESRRQVLFALSLSEGGSNIKWLDAKIEKLKIDTSHWLGQGHLKGKTHNWSRRIPTEDILVENSSYVNSTNLKMRLLKEGLLKYKCSECGIDEWNDKPLSLQLEHKNGIHTDNRIENLCLLCPNCHSQTPTYCGKNGKTVNIKQDLLSLKDTSNVKAGYRKIKINKCIDCDKIISDCGIRCKSCAGFKNNPPKISWPLDEDLLQMVQNSNYTKVAKELGVSDNAVRKRLKKRGLI